MVQRHYHCPKMSVYVFVALLSHVFLLRCNGGLVDAKEVQSLRSSPRANINRKKLRGRKLNTEGFYDNWSQFDTALAQERKKDSFDESNLKKCEKMADKHGITCTPSAMPSSAPSVAPSLSHVPSISVAPSLAPSESPSSRPTPTPSQSPTKVPSSTPTNAPTRSPSESPTRAPTASPSQSPTIAPTTAAPTRVPFETLFLTRDDGSQWQDSSCQTALPAGATQLQTDETQFEYFLQLQPNADPDANMKQIEQALATAMADEILTCIFNDGTRSSNPFETYGVTSLPVDERSSTACPAEIQKSGADCYVIKGGFTPTLFYWVDNNRRQLSFHRSYASQGHSEIVGVFGPILQGLLDSNTFVGGDILNTTYSGFLVGNSGTTSAPEDTDDLFVVGPTTVAIQAGDDSSSSSNEGGGQTGFVIGAICICLAIIALIVVSSVLLQRRKGAAPKQDYGEDLSDVEGVLDLDVEIDTDGRIPDKYDTRSVLQEGFPGDNTRYNNDGNKADGIEDVDSVNSGFGRTSNIEESSVDARRAVRGLNYSVVNDEATFDDSLYDLDSSAGHDPHDYTSCKSTTCFKCRSKGMLKPTFIKADLQAIQSDLGSNKKYSPMKHSRKYKADDTVNL